VIDAILDAARIKAGARPALVVTGCLAQAAGDLGALPRSTSSSHGDLPRIADAVTGADTHRSSIAARSDSRPRLAARAPGRGGPPA
jgi:hypothetical protein